MDIYVQKDREHMRRARGTAATLTRPEKSRTALGDLDTGDRLYDTV